MPLIVEDGTGVEGADSYISLEDATDYHASMGNDSWLDYSEDEQEVFLRRATRDLDILYGSRYDSFLLDGEQSLLWPRVAYRNALGHYVTGLPLRVAQATAELALLEADGNVLDPVADDTRNVRSTSMTLGDLSQSTTFFYPGGPNPRFSRVALLLGPFVAAGGAKYARINRG